MLPLIINTQGYSARRANSAERNYPMYPDVKIETLRWPVSAVRVTGKDVAQMQAFAEQFLQTWRGYSDASVDILATTEENSESVPHNLSLIHI